MILCVSERANGDISIPSFPDTACHRRSSLGRRWFVLPHEVSSYSHELPAAAKLARVERGRFPL
jgi:hypothetical protein